MSARDRLSAFLARTGLRAPVRRELAALACVAMLSWSLWSDGRTTIEDTSSTLMGIRELVAADSEHYLAMADAFREGDFSMQWVAPTGGADRAHRQPGFPALLALAGHFGVQGAPSLALVNVALVVLTLWIVYFGARLATGSPLAALLACAFVYDARFLMDIATRRLLVEPLYVAVAAGAVAAASRYAAREGPASLLAVAVLAGAAYLVRVNGLFLAASLALAMVVADVMRERREDPEASLGEIAPDLPYALYAAALALFLVVTVPSWLPRAIHAGNPVYHGYLPNYLWVDDYERAHQPGPPRYSLSTYTSEHGAADASSRMGFGLKRVFVETPREKFSVAGALALAIAVVVVFALREPAGMALVLAAVLQGLPLAWTALPNPVRRIPAAALLPFAALIVASAAAALLRRSREAEPSSNSRES